MDFTLDLDKSGTEFGMDTVIWTTHPLCIYIYVNININIYIYISPWHLRNMNRCLMACIHGNTTDTWNQSNVDIVEHVSLCNQQQHYNWVLQGVTNEIIVGYSHWEDENMHAWYVCICILAYNIRTQSYTCNYLHYIFMPHGVAILRGHNNNDVFLAVWR